MNILMIYPETPLTFWSFKDALKFVGKKSAESPLIFIGIETPNNNSLDEYGNTQNQRRDFVL